MWSEAHPPSAAQVRDAFEIEVGALLPHPGGFEADAFTDGRWFVKLWRQQPDDDAALALTAELAERGVPVPAAVRALDGSYTAEHDGRRYAVFPFVAGRPASWDELRAAVDRLEAVIERARAIDVPHVVCHHDLFPHNVLVDADGRLTALLDWGTVKLAPREHDLFVALCGPDPVRFLRAYGAKNLDLTHLEYARLARSLRDLAARITAEVDREGVDTWGFDGLRRVDADLALARPLCAR